MPAAAPAAAPAAPADCVAAGAAEAPPPRTPLPRFIMLTCFTTQLALAVFVTLPFTTLVFMVQDLKPGATPEALSRWTGLLASLSNLGMFVTSIPWGLASDRLGRRPVMLTGNASAALSVFALGCCRSYGLACTCRLLGGLANGTLGTMKAVLADVCDSTNSSWAFSILSVAWGAGAVLGPALGGLLSRPCASGGVLRGARACTHERAFLIQLPYFLPCLASALLCALSGALSWRMRETLPSKAAPLPPTLQPQQRGRSSTGAGHAREGYAPLEDASSSSSDDDEGEALLKSCSSCTTAVPADAWGDVELVARDAPDAAPPPPPPPPPRPPDGAPPQGARWYLDEQCVLCLLGYALCAFVYIQLDELLPIFAAAPVEAGGLGLSPQGLAAPLAFGGAAVFAFTLACYPPLVARAGLRAATRGGFAASAAAALFIPAASLPRAAAHAARVATLYAAVTFRGAAAVTVFTSSMILVNRAAPPGQLGEVNGAGQALAALVRGLGPALAGVEWAASVRAVARGAAGAQFLPFAAVGALALSGVALYARVRFEESDEGGRAPTTAGGAPASSASRSGAVPLGGAE